MSSPGEALAHAAQALIGTPFVPGGRDRATGVDCVGLIAVSLEAIGREVVPLPRYAIRQNDIGRLLALTSTIGLHQSRGAHRVGDILLLRPSPGQWHLAICGEARTIIHAHAGLRRTTMGTLPDQWPVEQSWRLN